MVVGLVWLAGIAACSAPQTAPLGPLAPTLAAATPVPVASALVAVTAAPTAVPAATVAPTRASTPTVVATATRVASGVAGLPTVETSADARGPGFLTPVEIDLPLAQPITDGAVLSQLVNDVQQLDGVASVRSDGLRIQVRYDSTRLIPSRIRDRLRELGHPANSGTDVQNPGDAAD